MKKNYLYIYFHVPKCGGSTIRRHLMKNFKPSEAVFISYPRLNLDNSINKKELITEHVDKYLLRFTASEKEKIKVIYGHTVPYGIHKHFKRPARYFTFVRKPNKRTISLYNFYRTMYLREDIIGRKRDHYYLELLTGGKVPSFGNWCIEKYRNPDFPVATMFQFMKEFGYIDEAKDSNYQINEMIKKFYFIGLMENYSDDVMYMYKNLGINKYFKSENKSINFVSNGYSKKTGNYLAKKNQLDEIIYKKAAEKNAIFKKNNRYFYEDVKQIKRRRMFTLPITQILYDFTWTLQSVSIYLKQRSKLYLKVWSYIRGIQR